MGREYATRWPATATEVFGKSTYARPVRSRIPWRPTFPTLRVLRAGLLAADRLRRGREQRKSPGGIQSECADPSAELAARPSHGLSGADADDPKLSLLPDPDGVSRVRHVITGGDLRRPDHDDPARRTSNAATGIIEILSRAGIEAQQRTYVLPNPLRVHRYVGILDGDTGPDTAERLRIAVLVRNRDVERATALPELRQELSQLQKAYPVGDAELTRQSLQAGQDVGRRTIDGG